MQPGVSVTPGLSEALLETYERAAPGSVGGNASEETKGKLAEAVAQWHHTLTHNGYAASTGKRCKLVEVSIQGKSEEPSRKEAKIVAEVTATGDMVNGYGTVHGGCIIFLIDVFSSLPVIAMNFDQTKNGDAGLSSSINTIYHAPAPVGATLRIVAWSTTVGGRTFSSRAEVWDATNRRLVASGTHVKMKGRMGPRL
ncbi:hypothetical protein CONPUDRAFT_168832 [Coniophora puteana RWD-64-598 SS2]|uniref:Thioesterase domain-containing protein n=1 Tax=Coniophora puteana (strain RWD-64-598) TaxID=741705 RepID=A0A5M3MC89_CONPW|nr:uncharacterized protein CONPUDRAFT_168832 [Coniophora puteana RWD-64-598 SS2]EIW76261.1 hypothetical protein CONPUDRAFT_168832 [Coniophora puteana RWD-64-598 SS2]